MQRVIRVAAGVVFLVALLPAAAQASTSSASSALYTWKLPANGQFHGWRASGGMLSYDGRSTSALFVPYTLHTTNFSIQAEMRSTGAGGIQATLAGFGLTVREHYGNPHEAVSGGSFYSVSEENNNPDLLWNGMTAGGQAFDPKTDWHLYRLDVQGDEYRLSIDGTLMVTYTIDDYPHPRRVGFFSTYRQVEIKSFSVYPLGAPSSPAPVSVPQLATLNLNYGDLPTDAFYLIDLRHWYTDAEVARERNVPEAQVQATGRLDAYGIDIAPDAVSVFDIYSEVTAYDTAQDAQRDVTARLATFQSQNASKGDYHAFDHTQVPLGSTGGGFTFTVDTGDNTTARGVTVYFAEGRYSVIVDEVFDASAVTAAQALSNALVLAQPVDARVQASP